MAPERLTVVVTGATGTQGSGVLEALERDKHFRARAVTRNAASKAAKAIAERGIDVVTADLSKKDTLAQAFAGAHAVFLVTEAGFGSPEEEVQQGRNAADAAKQANVKHFVFSGLIDPRPYKLDLPVDKASGCQIPHYESKAIIKEYIESIGLPLTTIYGGSFMENFFKYPAGFCLKGPQGNFFFSNNLGDGKGHWHSKLATGTAVLEALQNPDRCIGKEFVPAPDLASNSDVASAISQATGTAYSYHFMPDEEARALPFPAAVPYANMFQFLRDCQPAIQKRDSLPSLGEATTVQDFVQQHKSDFVELFTNASK